MGGGGTPRSRSTKSGWLLQLIFFLPPPPQCGFLPPLANFFKLYTIFQNFPLRIYLTLLLISFVKTL